jgi:hypothetical protein
VKAEDAQSLVNLQQHWQRDDGTRVYTIAVTDGVWTGVPEAAPGVTLTAASAYELREMLRDDYAVRGPAARWRRDR